ncbi:ammonia-forming cytochrome c nitrite reductase [Sulfurospirillum sp. T05]|uniref:nitrite reductase (cytochrome; ammonia-forming) n=1 Tax=Sulfurospirillum tamanense TaxID=2813362 RepID=A0ABS2WSW2_9BACT|nr:ammonia-forming cytochrome c nitrite reductase [Sulfurospirillum tamanensis]MBN2964717.1 ammonia-forming cytochrome c nitrite reductase [Sulfurospirillum tamanensis]
MKKFKLLLVASLLAIVSMAFLTSNINAREAERVALNEVQGIPANASVSSEWAKYYPRQYDSWKRTKEGDEMEDLLKKKPQLPVIWAGYRFSIDYNSPRGHYYAVQDNVNSLRTGAPVDDLTGPFPTACWTCKSPDVVRLMEEDGELEYFTGKWARYGSEAVNSVGCLDCHNPKTAELAMGREYLNRGLEVAGLPRFEDATHQEKRSLVCAQCHSEYYFKKTEYTDKAGKDQTAMVVTLPWHEGLTAEGMERYYDSIDFSDWTHKISKTPMLKAQHPGYEIAKTGIHYQKGVSCADCHMPYTQEGSVKYSDHKIGNPLDNMDRSCMTCHRESEDKLREIVHTKFERKEFLMEISMDNLAKAHLETGRAMELGATDEELKEIRTLLRHGQWRWDYAIASHGSFFHAPEETLRLLADASEKAQQARISLVRLLAKYGDAQYMAPDFDTKEKAQTLAGVNLQKEIEAKMKFKETLEKEWHKQAKAKGLLDEANRKDVDLESSYFKKK